MYLFNENGKIKKYDSYGAILKNFVKIRLQLYQTRKDYLLGKWRKEIDILKWKLKFVEAVIADEIIVHKKNTRQLNELLEELAYPKFTFGEKKKESYDYLTTMAIAKLCIDEVKKLREQLKNKKEEIETLDGKTPSQIWREELEEFMDAYDEWEKECDEAYNNLMSSRKGTINKKKRTKKMDKEVEI